jgi:hypothetical protein
MTYTRFFVEGAPPEDFRERFMRSIRHRVMRPLEPDEEELERSGWCLIGDPYALELSYDDVFYTEYVNLGFRTDRWVVPGATMKAAMRDAEKAYLAKKGREKLTRKEKTEMKEMVSRKLRRQMAPATRLVDLSWSLNEGLVRFFSHSEKVAGNMMELFNRTFGSHDLRLIPESPFTLAEHLGLSPDEQEAWNTMEASSFAVEGQNP